MAEIMNSNGTEVVNEARKKCLETISRINSVEGFDPTAVTKEVASAANPGQKENFLPLIWKKAWARMVYPLHRCHAKITEIKDGMVGAYAAFYVDNDPTKEAIGEGFAFTPIDAFAVDPAKARTEAISLALGSAKSRAYTDAGFGLQFWTDDCIDDLQAAAIAQMTGGTATGGANQMQAVPEKGEASPIPLVKNGEDEKSGDGSLASMIPLADETPASASTAPKARKSQYEVAKDENEELVALADQLVSAVDALRSAAIGSAEHNAAQKTLEAIRDKWGKLSSDIAAKMAKPSVQAAKAADTGYAFFNKTYDQVLAEAKVNARTQSIVEVEDTTSVEPEPDETVVTEAEIMPEEPVVASQPAQMTVFMMSLEEAKAVCSSCGSYSGKTMGELYDNKVTRQILPKLFERTDEKNERLAIKTLIESDADLTAYCERNGKTLEV